jgi:catechol 2,3-dioxygenase-like lactoylglutathione lyase family enzyme
MALHRLSYITMGVPNVAETGAYYEDFGLESLGEGRYGTLDGGEQLRIVHAPNRRLVEMGVACDDQDDLGQVTSRMSKLGIQVEQGAEFVAAIEPITNIRVVVQIAHRVTQDAQPQVAYNGPGHYDRKGERADGVMREYKVQPRRLGHVVTGSPNYEATVGFMVEGIGFKVSDEIKGAGMFIRCSSDHHNMLVLKSPVAYLHHSSWQVNDIDDVGRGAFAMLEADPERHVWGLGRHHAGSNFFWYLKDPAGNFSEYFADMDCIPEDEIWEPEVFEGAQGLYNWGPPPPPSFLKPEDLAALMTGVHSK